MTSMEKAFELFRRENPGIDILPKLGDPEVKWPAFRHNNYIPQRSAPTEGGRDPSEITQTDDDSNGGENGDSGNGNGIGNSGGEDEDDGNGNGTGGMGRRSCNFDDNGNFNADAIATANSTVVEYQYRAETLSAVDFENEVMPYLERMILKSVVPKIFNCDNRLLSSDWSKMNSRRLDLVGASTNPEDVISDNKCTTNRDDSVCNEVDGRMTLFTFGGDQNEIDTVEKLVCDTLNDGVFASSHPAITSLECIMYDSSILGNGGESEVNNGAPVIDPSATQTFTPAAIISSLAAIMVVLGVYTYRRRSKGGESNTQRGYLDDSDVNNSNSVSFEDLPMAWSTQSKPNRPAFDMHSIIPKGYEPETIHEVEDEECSVIDEESNELDEVSLDQLDMNLGDVTDLS